MPSSEMQVPPIGGFTLTWLLAGPVRSFTSKATGSRKTVIELRDPQRLSQSLTLFLDGDAGAALTAAAPRSAITLHVEELRSGRARGELIGTAERAVVEAAFERAGRAS